MSSSNQPRDNSSGDIRVRKVSNIADLNSANEVYFGPYPTYERYPPPAKFNFKNINGNTVRLSWVAPEKSVQSYEIAYAPLTSQRPLAEEQRIWVKLAVGFSGFAFWFKRNNLNNFKAFILHGRENQTLLHISQPGKVYDVRIRARYELDQSIWASTLAATNTQANSGLI